VGLSIDLPLVVIDYQSTDHRPTHYTECPWSF